MFNVKENDSKSKVGIVLSTKELLSLRFASRVAFDCLGDDFAQFRKHKAILEDFIKRTDYLFKEESKNDV